MCDTDETYNDDNNEEVCKAGMGTEMGCDWEMGTREESGMTEPVEGKGMKLAGLVAVETDIELLSQELEHSEDESIGHCFRG